MDDVPSETPFAIAAFALVQGVIGALFGKGILSADDLTTVYSAMSDALSKETPGADAALNRRAAAVVETAENATRMKFGLLPRQSH